ncbi:DUF2460 domain-containing protein [Phyllobacterium sp. 21LDTY02-6]|jgi:uncharacterized protein (TIGR02217 family)|uniref:DUF2460 domain-containing protein n=1 Tax=Phyllobacterium sp. 21LDTY02-6 TaxID=2944903 RepID=UPI00202117B2|nr:DUF2460 domain-containing protein [Phyllobacterium sp. 21LDTY02-6]MCO4318340.1 DUF2460 domain-containing protein [Phyllobacterium sp. 21LDTY02-6]
MTPFHDVRFPAAVSFGASGGPEWRNEIVQLTSGREQRNARWAQSRRRYDVGTGLRSLADLEAVMAFFEARRGSLHAFRFQDPFDHLSCASGKLPTPLDQLLGEGDGKRAEFQLVKRYGDYARHIARPRVETVRVTVGGIEQRAGLHFSVDGATGRVLFQAHAIPQASARITAGFAFDVPVRFDTDQLSACIKSFRAGNIPSIPIIEVKS